MCNKICIKGTAFLMMVLILATTALPFASAEDSLYQAGDVETTESEREVGNPIFVITMENGSIMRGELYPSIAPESVGNFVALANSGFYDGLIFHRVIPGFMIQGGCPEGSGRGNPGWAIKGEFSANGVKNDLKHTTGVLSMARSSALDSAGSQFFIMAADYPSLNGQYAAFGKVLEGLDVVQEVVNVQRNANDKPNEDQRIKTIRVETFDKEYPFEKLAR